MTDKALRYNEGKPEWTLVDFDSLEPMVRVLEFGAKKYTKHLLSLNDIIQYFQLWQKHESVQIVQKRNTSVQNDYVLHAIDYPHGLQHRVSLVEKLDNCEVSECVHHVLKKNEGTDLQKTGADTNSTSQNTIVDQSLSELTQKESNSGNRIHDIWRKLNAETSGVDSGNIESQKIFISKDVNQAVQYAEAKSDYTLIIAMIHDSSEIYFVANATNDFDCLMTLFNSLKHLGIISKDTLPRTVTGRDNWKKPMDKKKILDSLMRHLVRLMADEELDSESKLQHIGHILCNAMFYSYHSKNK